MRNGENKLEKQRIFGCQSKVELSLVQNPKCVTGVMIEKRVFVREDGTNKKPELLCLIYADLYESYIWGHVFQPEGFDQYVACLIMFGKFITGRTSDHLFERFHWAIRQEGRWEPVTCQKDGDSFSKKETFEEACDALCHMIEVFDFKKRRPFENDEASDDPSEYRILDVYPFPSCRYDVWEEPPY